MRAGGMASYLSRGVGNRLALRVGDVDLQRDLALIERFQAGDSAVLQATCTTGLDGFLQLEPDWRDLVQRAAAGNPFLSWEWVSEWAETFWDDSVIAVVVRLGSRPVAIAPFFTAPPLPRPAPSARQLQVLGPRGQRNLLEMGAVLVEPGCAADAIRSIISLLFESTSVDWFEVAASGNDLRAWDLALATPGLPWTMFVEESTEIPVMRLDQNWSQLRTRLRRNVKESVRHAYNAPCRDGINYVYTEHRSTTGLDDVIDDFIRLHALRAAHPGKPHHGNLFEYPHLQAFLKRVLHRMAAAGLVNVGVLTIDGERVAARINFEIDDTLYLYYSGFDPKWWRYSVMTFMVTEAIRSAMSRHLRLVNFSPGVDQAKSRWDVDLVPFRRFSVIRDRPSSRTRFAVYRRIRQGRKRWRSTGWRSLPNGR
jgi:CelD/BcsL family acetyltransferase involved in cellulose biosynthesis